MEISPVSFQGAKFARRKQMTPTQKKIQTKIVQTTQALLSKKIAKIQNNFINNQYLKKQSTRAFV